MSLAAALSIMAAAINPLSLRAETTPRLLYDWREQHCRPSQIPDAPARAFRRADGQISLIATHYDNWSLTGSSFEKLQPGCGSLIDLKAVPDDAGRLWIEAVHTADGKTIAALLSQDFSHYLRASGCSTKGGRGRCWLGKIIAARSDDMGASFVPDLGPSGVVAATAHTYPADATGRVGVFTTTNIVKRDGAYYMIAYAEGGEGQSSGNCLFRTRNPLVSGSWRGWDGRSYSRRLSGDQPCKPLANLPPQVRSLSYIKKKDVWVAVFASSHRLSSDAAPVPGFYYSRSQDLLSWSPPQRIVPAPIRPRQGGARELWSYPSLLDPQSSSRNFDIVDGDRAVLIFTRTPLIRGNSTMHRDLVYLDIHIG